MKCELCNKNEATILVKQVTNNEISEVHLCQICAINNYQDLSFENFFQTFLNSFIMPNQNVINDNVHNFETKKCDFCEMTFNDITKLGKVGCSNCYETFENELSEIILKLQGNNIHSGKFPNNINIEILKTKKIEDLRKKLSICVNEENYEEAAKIRDEIKAIIGGSINDKMV